MMKRRFLLILLISVLVLQGVFASPRFFMGVSFNYDANYLAPALHDKLDVIQDIDSSSSPAFNGKDVTGLHGVGPKLELFLFPFDIPLGIGVTGTTLFTVGFMATDGGDVYFSRKADFRQDLSVMLLYQQAFSPKWGLFLDCGLTYSWYRIATTNKNNDKTPVDYIRFNDWGLSADFGVYLENRGSFFKVGGVFYYDLAHMEKFSFRYGLTVGGGLTFGGGSKD